MKKRNLYITEYQDRALRELVEIKGIKVSEQIRRAIDLYLEFQKKGVSFTTST